MKKRSLPYTGLNSPSRMSLQATIKIYYFNASLYRRISIEFDSEETTYEQVWTIRKKGRHWALMLRNAWPNISQLSSELMVLQKLQSTDFAALYCEIFGRVGESFLYPPIVLEPDKRVQSWAIEKKVQSPPSVRESCDVPTTKNSFIAQISNYKVDVSSKAREKCEASCFQKVQKGSITMHMFAWMRIWARLSLEVLCHVYFLCRLPKGLSIGNILNRSLGCDES